MDNSTGKRITQAELARLLKVSRTAVHKAIKSGRITAGEDGLIDRERAMADWAANTRAAMKPEPSKEPQEKRERGGQPKYATARARKELALARMAELKEERLRGLYCLTSDVEKAVTLVVTEFRVRIEGLPNRLAGELAHKDADSVRALLKKEVHSALTRMHDDACTMVKELSTPDESEFPSSRLT